MLLGHVRALCPGCLQALQSRALLAGGSSVSGVSVAVAVEVEVVAVAVAAVVPVGRGVDELGGGGGAGDGSEEEINPPVEWMAEGT